MICTEVTIVLDNDENNIDNLEHRREIQLVTSDKGVLLQIEDLDGEDCQITSHRGFLNPKEAQILGEYLLSIAKQDD